LTNDIIEPPDNSRDILGFTAVLTSNLPEGRAVLHQKGIRTN